jgi:hypothetical protein
MINTGHADQETAGNLQLLTITLPETAYRYHKCYSNFERPQDSHRQAEAASRRQKESQFSSLAAAAAADAAACSEARKAVLAT